MTSSNGSIFRVTDPLCGEFTSHVWIPHTKPVTRSFDVSLICTLNKRLSKQSGGWWFGMTSHSLWRHCNGTNDDHVHWYTLPGINKPENCIKIKRWWWKKCLQLRHDPCDLPCHMACDSMTLHVCVIIMVYILYVSSHDMILLFITSHRVFTITHCGLLMPCTHIHLGQHWPRQWLVSSQHQAITWNNGDLSSVKSFSIHLMPISKEMLKISIC